MRDLPFMICLALVVLLGVGLIATNGRRDDQLIAKQQLEQDSVLTKNLTCNKIIERSGLDGEYPVLFTDNKEFAVWWKDWRGKWHLFCPAGDQLEVVERQGKPASIHFKLDIVRHTEAGIKDAVPVTGKWIVTSDRNYAIDKFQRDFNEWHAFNANPGRSVSERIEMATLYAPRVQLVQYGILPK